ncbi:1383_t:CDS:2, partial [Racocetra persica]
ISYGPFSVDNENHVGEDFTRLAKFGNDALNHFYFFVKKLQENEQMIKLLDDLKIILLWTVSKNGTISNGQVTDYNVRSSLIIKSIQIISMVNDMVKRRQLLEETKISDDDTVTSVFTPES